MSNDRNVKATRYVYSLAYYSVIKQNEIMILAAAWMNQEIIILCEVSQRDKHVISIGGIYKFIPVN